MNEQDKITSLDKEQELHSNQVISEVILDTNNLSSNIKNDPVDIDKNNEQSKNQSENNVSARSPRRSSRSRSRSSRHSRRRSRSRSHSHRRHRKHTSSHHRSRSRSKSDETGKRKNTLFSVIKNVEAEVMSQREGTIPNFNFIEPRYPYGKDLYIGNISEGCYPEDIVNFLNKAMKTANLNKWPGEPVLSCRILPKFCFVTLRHEDEATAALNMDGIYYRGQRLKLNRPVDYSGPVTDHRTWQEICPDVTWDEMFDVSGCDYKWVVKELEELPQEVIALCTGSDESSLTPYLEITNLVTLYDVEAVNDHAGLIEELKEELQKYGMVNQILLPTKGEYKGKVYVAYEKGEEAKTAFKSLWSRMFDNRLIGICFVSKQQWAEMMNYLEYHVC